MGGQINLGEQSLEGALKGVVLDVFETRLQGVEQLPVLPPGHVGDAGPEVFRLDDVMHLAPHLLFKLDDIVGVVRIPKGERHAAAIDFQLGIVRSQFALDRRLVVVRQVAQEQERQHVVAEIVGVHRATQLVGDVPEGFAQLGLVLVGHFFGRSLIWFSRAFRSASSC